MAKLTLNNVTNFADNSTAVTTTSANNDAIEAFAETVLSRDGTSPNAMNVDIDMNSNRIINLATPTNNSDAATKFYVDDRTGNAPDHAAAAEQSALEAAQSASAANVAKEDAELAQQAAENAQAAAEQAKEDTEQLLSSITFPLSIEDGGTGATDAAGARSALGLGALAEKSSVETADLADDAVTLAKMEHGTQGDILYYGASGAPTRLSPGTAGQVLRSNGADANPDWVGHPFTDYVVFGPYAITNGNTITVAHGLGAVPKLVWVTLRCTTANLGYAVGDEVDLTTYASTGAGLSSSGYATAKNATNVIVQIGSAGIAIAQRSATTGNVNLITNGSWELFINVAN